MTLWGFWAWCRKVGVPCSAFPQTSPDPAGIVKDLWSMSECGMRGLPILSQGKSPLLEYGPRVQHLTFGQIALGLRMLAGRGGDGIVDQQATQKGRNDGQK